MNYVPLHVHTSDGSIGDSTLKLDEYIEKAKRLSIKSLAITDHGSLTSMYSFISKCHSEDIKPIIGCEIYEVEDDTIKTKDTRTKYNHLILLAKNQNGIKNLLQIVNYSQLEGMYYQPRISLDNIKKYSKDIICLTACVKGKIPELIINDEIEQAEEHLLKYKDIFDNVFLEIQPGDFKEQDIVNAELIKLSNKHNIPLVATNDIHYLDKEDYIIHDIHCKINRKITVTESENNELLYPDSCYYLKDYTDLFDSFNDSIDKNIVKQAIDNTLLIDELCEDIKLVDKLFMPVTEKIDNLPTEETLRHIAVTALNKMINNVYNPAEYATRLYYELEVLDATGYSPYFMIVKDFIDHAKSVGIEVGPGRGSVAGSLVAFLIGITDVDPIKYNLPFERFHSIYRKGSNPDIDLDFCSERREEMFDYIINKYGSDCCSLVSTKLIRKAKSALKDAGRYLEFDNNYINEICKLVPEVAYGDDGEKTTDIPLKDAIMLSDKLLEYYKKHEKLFNIAMKLEDLTRSSSIHAAGTLIAPIKLNDYIPLRRSEKNINASALTLEDAEIAQLLKFDILGLATLSVINKTKVITKDIFDIRNDRFDCEGIWNLIGSKNTVGLFQISSNTYKQRMHRLKPKTIEELAICLALVRGPCISNGFDETYMQILEGKTEREYIHPIYDTATDDTFGILVFQEQLMKIAQNVGFSIEDSYKLMKTVAKKKIDKIKEYEEEFRNKCYNRNIPEEIVSKVWSLILNAGSYLFNRGHAVSYALLCYESAYYKYNYPDIYMANHMTNIYLHSTSKDKEDKITESVYECRRLGIKFLPVEVNKSKTELFVESKNNIRMGYCSVKALPFRAMDIYTNNIINSLEEIIEDNIHSLKKTEIVPLIVIGGFREFGDKNTILQRYFDFRKEELKEEISLSGAVKIKYNSDISTIEKFMYSSKIGIVETIVNNFKHIGFSNIPNNKYVNISAIISKTSKKKDKNGNEMSICNCETADGPLKIIVFNKQYKEYKKLLKKNKIIDINGRKDNDNILVYKLTEKESI